MDSDELDTGALLDGAYLEEDADDEEDQDEPTLTFKVDHGRIRYKTDELDAMVRAVDKILKTDRFVYAIYDDQYGNDLNELIGKSFDYAETEVERIIVEALTADERVINVEIEKIWRIDKDTLGVTGTCYTVYGDVPIESEVTLNNESE